MPVFGSPTCIVGWSLYPSRLEGLEGVGGAYASDKVSLNTVILLFGQATARRCLGLCLHHAPRSGVFSWGYFKIQSAGLGGDVNHPCPMRYQGSDSCQCPIRARLCG